MSEEEDSLRLVVVELSSILVMVEKQLQNAWEMLEIIEQKRRSTT